MSRYGRNIVRMLLFLISIIGVGISASIVLKMSVGLGPWDSLCQSLSFLTKLEVGTVGIILNVILIVLQIILYNKDFKIINLFQVLLSVLLGSVVNFTFYTLLSALNISNYILRLIIFVISISSIAFCISLIVSLKIVPFPAEGFSLAVSAIFKLPFHRVRQVLDLIFITIALSITLIFKFPLIIREGTVIAALILGPLIGFFTKKQTSFLQRHKIIPKN